MSPFLPRLKCPLFVVGVLLVSGGSSVPERSPLGRRGGRNCCQRVVAPPPDRLTFLFRHRLAPPRMLRCRNRLDTLRLFRQAGGFLGTLRVVLPRYRRGDLLPSQGLAPVLNRDCAIFPFAYCHLASRRPVVPALAREL